MFYHLASMEKTPADKAPQKLSQDHTLSYASSQFLISLPPEVRAKAQPELTKFVRWYGEERLISELSGPEIEGYAEHLTATIAELAEKVSPIKDFLIYAYQKKLIKSRLAHLLKVKKNAGRQNYRRLGQEKKDISLTAEGFTALQTELQNLIRERPQIVDEIRKAAADKDFRENAPLEAARDYQGKVEGRIRELEAIIKSARILDEKQGSSHTVSIGDNLIVRDLTTDETFSYVLVNVKEANPSAGKISTISPIGKALLGHKVGDKVEVNAPAGMLPYRIEDIKQG
jgi:transcription elongation factor GreA